MAALRKIIWRKKFKKVMCRVSDPYSFFTDPDPDPVDPDGGQYGSGSRALMRKN